VHQYGINKNIFEINSTIIKAGAFKSGGSGFPSTSGDAGVTGKKGH
jgi:hypothetical protein